MFYPIQCMALIKICLLSVKGTFLSYLYFKMPQTIVSWHHVICVVFPGLFRPRFPPCVQILRQTEPSGECFSTSGTSIHSGVCLSTQMLTNIFSPDGLIFLLNPNILSPFCILKTFSYPRIFGEKSHLQLSKPLNCSNGIQLEML